MNTRYPQDAGPDIAPMGAPAPLTFNPMQVPAPRPPKDYTQQAGLLGNALGTRTGKLLQRRGTTPPHAADANAPRPHRQFPNDVQSQILEHSLLQ